MSNNYFKKNNFDLIRLFAALEVSIVHASDYLSVGHHTLIYIVGCFPGVPIFFFISGFLISASWERGENVRVFALNRFLRIYPALWLAFFVSIGLILFMGRLNLWPHLGGFLAWTAAQITILQFWNPSFLRSYGTGVANASLWTIPVELSFYLLTPIMYWIGRRLRSLDAVLVTIAAVSFGVQYWLYMTAPIPMDALRKGLQYSTVPWIGMFCVGVLAQRHISTLHRFVAGKVWLFLLAYVAVCVTEVFVPLYPLIWGASNSVGILKYLVLCGLVLSLAYSFRGVADSILRRNDISYGIYIYHMMMVNAVLELGFVGRPGFFMVLVGTCLCALTSWFLVERPALELRKKALYSRDAPEDAATNARPT